MLASFSLALLYALSEIVRLPRVLWPSQALGLLGALAIVISWFQQRREVSPLTLFPAIILTLYCVYRGQVFQHLSTQETTFDLYTLYVDRSFGFHPSLWCFQLVDHLQMFSFLNLIYGSLSFAMGLTFATHMGPKQHPWHVFAALALAGLLGPQCYKLLPVCGPVWLLGSPCYTGEIGMKCADVALSDLARVQLDSAWPRNGMPSLHLGWALLIWFLCRDLKFGRWIAFIFLLLTALATLGGGEHYFVDLIAAFPFALMIWTLCIGGLPITNPRRLFPIMASCATFLIWVMCIRFEPQLFWASPIIPWLSSLMIVAGTLVTFFAIAPDRSESPVASAKKRQPLPQEG